METEYMKRDQIMDLKVIKIPFSGISWCQQWDLRILIQDVTQEIMDTPQIFFLIHFSTKKMMKWLFLLILFWYSFSFFRWRMKITVKYANW